MAEIETITQELLTGACADGASDAGLRIEAELEPFAEDGRVKPATYAGGVYQIDRVWRTDISDAPVYAVSIDNPASQANRLEAALEEHADRLGLPLMILDVAATIDKLPAHLPPTLSSLRWPHRHADAYLRDAASTPDDDQAHLDAIRDGLFRATERNADALYEWFPQSLLYGWWQSHLSSSISQSKRARAWTSRITGIAPAADPEDRGPDTLVNATKGDAYNLSLDTQVEHDDDPAAWSHTTRPLKEKDSDAKVGLSSVGHGQIVSRSAERALGPLGFHTVEQRATLSLPLLRRVTTGTAESSRTGTEAERDAAGRALLAAIGIFAHIAAFGRPFHLRSGADLRVTNATWTWLGATGGDDRRVSIPSLDEAAALVEGCAEAARTAGLPVGPAWPNALRIVPDERVVTAIKKTYGLA